MKKRVAISHSDLFRSIGNTIAKDKRVIMAIAKSRKEPAFFYTIGNQEKQLPELLIIGNFKSSDICGILNVLSDYMLEDGAYKSGDPINLGGEYPLLIYSANETAKKDYTVQAGQFYANEDYDVMQVILPDKKGIYPPDPKCHKDFQVPVLRALTVS